MNGQSGILVLKVEISTNNQACPPHEYCPCILASNAIPVEYKTRPWFW